MNSVRDIARLAGQKTYMPVRPCARGHIELRSVANGSCLQCNRDNQNAYRAKNAERDRESSRKWYAENKERALAWKRQWIANNPEKYKERRRRYRSKLPSRAREMFAATKWSAREKGVLYELDIAWIVDKLTAGKCELTGIAFNLEPLENGRQNPYTASLDRIIPERGYVKSNVRCILWALNAAFNSYGEGVYADIARVYLARHPDKTGLS